jgi:hypothetical protein
LEDDCEPHRSFFDYCDELLERYRLDARVMAITGDNFQGGRRRGEASYYFSRYMHVWGWASWRRAWNMYDLTMRTWKNGRDRVWLREYLGDPTAALIWESIFSRAAAGRINTWDYQWMHAIWKADGLVITPNVNLVRNFGAGEDATHTSVGMPETLAGAMKFPLLHPPCVKRDQEADDFVQRTNVSAPRFLWLRRTLLRMLGQ